ncbi:SCO4225 family membrane protein [Streptomyces sp. NPDC002285]
MLAGVITHDQPDASLAGVYLLMVTSPVSTGLLDVTDPLFASDRGALITGVVAMAVGAIVNAWLIGLVTRALRPARGR